MPQQKIVPIVEGDGEVTAVPVLLNRLLRQRQRFNIGITRPKNANSRSNLTKPNGIEKFLGYARTEKGCAAILVLIDSEEDCSVELAFTLANRARLLKLPFPIAIVCAKCEYEAWFLASLPSIVGKQIGGRPGLPEGLTMTNPLKTFVESKNG